jgi:hypothetical protein
MAGCMDWVGMIGIIVGVCYDTHAIVENTKSFL